MLSTGGISIKDDAKRCLHGLAWGDKDDLTAVFTDLGVSAGMWIGITRAHEAGRQVEFRTLRTLLPATERSGDLTP